MAAAESRLLARKGGAPGPPPWGSPSQGPQDQGTVAVHSG